MLRIVGPPILAFIFLATSLCADDKAAMPSERSPHGLALARQAQAAFTRQDWPKAVAAYAEVVRENPYSGPNWSNFGSALHSLKRHDEAVRAWDKSVALGFQPQVGLYNMACAYSLAGRKDEAIASLQKAMGAGFNQEETLGTDSDLDALRADPRFKSLIGTPPKGLSREERWRFDLDYLVRRMEKVHYNLYAKVTRERFQQAVTELKSRIGSLKDEEIAVGVQRILALVGDGHTVSVWRPQHDEPLRRYPVELYLYKEGLYVRAAAAEYAAIVGGKVVKIGHITAEEALTAVEPLCSRDNEMGVKWQSPIFLANPAVLSYLKIAEDMTHVSLVVRKLNGQEVAVDLKPAPINRAAVNKFVKANLNAKTPEPISFRNNDSPYWFEYLPHRKLIYFQFNAVANKPAETLEKFCDRLFRLIKEKPVDTLIVDMRNNGGGNTFLNRPLVHGLIRSDKTNRLDHLFVLVGRRTFSAAMNGAVDIERNTNSIFVGEPTGSSPNFVGENTILTLPCSSLRVSCSSLSWQRSLPMDRRTWIEPEIVAEPSMVAFAANRDPGLEAIFAHLDAQSDISMTGTIVFNETSSNAAQTIGSSREQGEGEAAKTMAAAKATALRQIVEERNRKVIEDFKKGDMHAVARSYADDATIYFAQGQHVHGRQAIDRYWQAVKGAKDWKLEALEVGGTSEAIYEIGKSTLTTKTNGEDHTYVCDYVVIWKRQKDGTYRTHTDIFN